MARKAAQEETDHWKHEDHVNVIIEKIGDRPAGSQPHDGIMAETFSQVMEAMGKAMHISEAGSTDCNVPVSLGVPAAVLGYGGTGGNCHNPEEWYRPDPNYPGPAHSLLMLLALTGLEGVCDGVIVKKK